ncbi:MAG: sigma 54-interacting transcriptional regulator [Candidatus Eisenbacteria bacterium]|uniref:Sigma 54-interacting transcriptional regulator n=1 Tax=Eiseniibacteriota bacterium TaxID=2212470 RepID=A0A956LVI7_UNCEI|nr:sigma 54-interacting transcriptional regulator [Candidatus Eisenbacteria bacterium]
MNDPRQGRKRFSASDRGVDPEGALDEASDIAADLARSGVRVPGRPPALSLERQVREWGDQRSFQLLYDAMRGLVESLDFESLVHQILDVAVRSIGADRGIVFLGGSLDSNLFPVAVTSVDPREVRDLSEVSRTILERALGGESTLTVDAASDPVLADAPSVKMHQLRSVLCVPLRVRDELIGAVYLDRRNDANAFSSASMRFLDAFVELASGVLQRAHEHHRLRQENQRLRNQIDPRDPFAHIVTGNPRMRRVLGNAELVARVDAPVMITGESGTGKELLARAIHQSSPRASEPLVTQNCAAVPADLLESLFFGHIRGAFTGAHRDTAGLFQLAHRGVLFLDEIAELAAPLQAKLLRVLETGVVRPLGSEEETRVDVRLIAATSRNLWDAVREGRFREDLFYRISVIELGLPPLRERRDDIPLLLDHFAIKHEADRDRRMRFDRTAIDFLSGYPWRGNVRELENFVRRALVFHAGRAVGPHEVAELLRPAESEPAPRPEAVESRPIPPPNRTTSFKTLEEREREAIVDALRITGGNRTRAAELLGQHRNALLRKIKRLGIDG